LVGIIHLCQTLMRAHRQHLPQFGAIGG